MLLDQGLPDQQTNRPTDQQTPDGESSSSSSLTTLQWSDLSQKDTRRSRNSQLGVQTNNLTQTKDVIMDFRRNQSDPPPFTSTANVWRESTPSGPLASLTDIYSTWCLSRANISSHPGFSCLSSFLLGDATGVLKQERTDWEFLYVAPAELSMCNLQGFQYSVSRILRLLLDIYSGVLVV